MDDFVMNILRNGREFTKRCFWLKNSYTPDEKAVVETLLLKQITDEFSGDFTYETRPLPKPDIN